MKIIFGKNFIDLCFILDINYMINSYTCTFVLTYVKILKNIHLFIKNKSK